MDAPPQTNSQLSGIMAANDASSKTPVKRSLFKAHQSVFKNAWRDEKAAESAQPDEDSPPSLDFGNKVSSVHRSFSGPTLSNTPEHCISPPAQKASVKRYQNSLDHTGNTSLTAKLNALSMSADAENSSAPATKTASSDSDQTHRKYDKKESPLRMSVMSALKMP